LNVIRNEIGILNPEEDEESEEEDPFNNDIDLVIIFYLNLNFS